MLPLRADFNPKKTRADARRTMDGPQVRRLLALTPIWDGATDPGLRRSAV